jgi:hypothetical protein
MIQIALGEMMGVLPLIAAMIILLFASRFLICSPPPPNLVSGHPK